MKDGRCIAITNMIPTKMFTSLPGHFHTADKCAKIGGTGSFN